jgi:pantoate--beta-alanine ligase
MIIVSKIIDLQNLLHPLRTRSRKIGLVPTMGALHEGHLSLIEASVKNKDIIVVSIFVNPTQFNDPKDLEHYPRDLKADISMLSKYPVDILFTPAVEEMYPKKDTREFDLFPLDSVMEGSHRPGHFNGVAQIVSKLFYAVIPDRAYFGLKDFQQLAIIRKMLSQLKMNIELIGCPIIREKDGLAMSSRNQLLNKEERNAAPLIHHTLEKVSTITDKLLPAEIGELVKTSINNHPLMKLEYFEIVDDQRLMPIKEWNDAANKIACIAVQIGKIRLIDNRYFV